MTINLLLEVTTKRKEKQRRGTNKFVKILTIQLLEVFVLLSAIIKSEPQFVLKKQNRMTVYTLTFKLIKIKFNVKGEFFKALDKLISWTASQVNVYSLKVLRIGDVIEYLSQGHRSHSCVHK